MIKNLSIPSWSSGAKSQQNDWHASGKQKGLAVKPNCYAIALILLAQLTGPICSAQFNQYTKLKRGQPCPFDSCVATNLPHWRTESLYIKTIVLENESLYSENKSLRSEINLADSATELYKSELLIVNRANVRKDSINKLFLKNLADIHTIASDALKPPTWWERNKLWIGILGGVLGTYLITR